MLQDKDSDIIEASQEERPSSPSILCPRKRKIRTSENKASQTDGSYVQYIKVGEDDIRAVMINIEDAHFFNTHPRDPRNECFAALIAFEMEKIQPEDRSLVYLKIIDYIRKVRGERSVNSTCPSPEY